MGAQDGAEVAELTGIYLLKQVEDFLSSLGDKAHAGLYRDDGLIYIENANGTLINKIEKALHRIFKRSHLKISIEQKGLSVNFLDVTLGTDGSYKPYRKPNGITKYVNKASNHPPSILKNIPDIVHDIIVHHPGSFINSDHSRLTFGIRTFIKRKKASKRSIYNYKKANWKGLNRDLNRVDWHFILNNEEPDTGWNIFKTKFLLLCDKHIPKIKIKESFQPPWFDSDVFKLNKKKKHFGKLFKETNDTKYYKKLSSLRKQLKFLIKSKMRSNFDDELSPNTITKKFWSSVKSVTKSSRIPDKMYLNDCIRTEPEEIANLFNKHFFDQFSDKSSYDIDIDFTNDAFYDFSFDKLTIYNHLKQINPNKSQGPDKIGGLVIKNCAISISLPLSILFNISYRTGIIPVEWKTANIVPVHKKGDKSSINTTDQFL